MKINRLLKASAIFACLTVIFFTVAVAVTPSLLESKHIRSQVKQVLSKWAGGKVKISGPIQINYFLGAQLSAEKITITDFKTGSPVQTMTAKAMKAQISWLSLLSGRVSIDQLTLDHPNIVLSNNAIPANIRASKRLQRLPLARLIKRATVNELKIENGSLQFQIDGRKHNMSEIDGRLYFSKRARKISGHSTFRFLDKPHTLSFRSYKLKKFKDSAEFAFRYEIDNPLLSTAFKGQLSVGDKIGLVGQKRLKALNVRQLADWLNHPLPKGNGMEEFDMSANISLSGNQLVLSDASLKLDGNKADGTLNIEFIDKIEVSGSLDVRQLSLLPYLGHEHSGSIANIGASQDSKQAGYQLLTYLLKNYRADMRVSVSDIYAPNFRAGNSALSVYLSNETLLVDVADMNVCNGNASGQLEINARGSIPQLSVLGIFRDISTSQCLKKVGPHGVVQGKASINVKLTGKGKSLNEVASSLAGTWSIKMASGGQVHTDLADLFGRINVAPMKGWSSLKTGITRFENLDISSDMRDGTAIIKTVMLAADKSKFSGTGSIDIPQHKLNYLVTMSSHNNAKLSRLVKDGKKMAIKVRGSLNSPEIAIGDGR